MIEEAVPALDAAVRSEMEGSGQPGLTLGLTDKDRTLTVRTYGFANLASQEPVTPETLFEIGSIGKSFTALAILQLVDEGRIELDSPVARFLPWFAVPEHDGDSPISIAHLLSHTAGIVAGVDATPEAAFQVWALRDLRRSSPPGGRFHYSNVGYKALGLVLEAVEGRPYPEVLRARILDPLGMSATEPAITHAVRPRLAAGYGYLHDDRMGHAGAPLVPATWLETATADGSIASNAADMCAFVRALLDGGKSPVGPLLSAGAFEEMTTGHIDDGEGGEYGYGLSIRTVHGRRYIGHGGGMVGYSAGMQTDPEEGIGAIVLQNGASLSPMALARTAIQIVRDVAPAPARRGRAARSESEAAEQALAGVYVSNSPDAQPIEIVAGDTLTLRFDDREVVLEALEEDLFVAPDEALDRFPFHVERPPGNALELWHGDRRFVRAGAQSRRLPEPLSELRAIVGHYRSHNPWTTNFRVFLRGDRPWLLFADAPDGFVTEQQLEPRSDGSFGVADAPGNPESLSFDTITEGRALRAWLSGWPYYRAD